MLLLIFLRSLTFQVVYLRLALGFSWAGGSVVALLAAPVTGNVGEGSLTFLAILAINGVKLHRLAPWA